MNSNWNNGTRNDDRKEDKPPYSRIFVVCSKQLREDDLRGPFEKFGNIEDLYIPKDRTSGNSKGVAYIKYDRTSSAAAAIEHMHMKYIGDERKPLKVMVASTSQSHNNQTANEDKYRRLFIKISKHATETEIRRYFTTFGHVESVHLHRDKNTDEVKGFAYIHYKTFYEAAKAFEECDDKYKAMFATPKSDLKRSRYSLDSYTENNLISNSPSFPRDNLNIDYYSQPKNDLIKRELLPAKPQGYKVVDVTCSPSVPQQYIEKLFNIIPSMTHFHMMTDNYNNYSRALITYQEEAAAALAVEKINNFQFPSGQVVLVKPDDNPLSKAANDLNEIVNNFKNSLETGNTDIVQLADAIAQATSLIKAATTLGKNDTKVETQNSYCSVTLPPPQPLVSNRSVAQRCFVVCKPRPCHSLILVDAFSCFGDLIDVTIIPNKTFGFAKYASVSAAQAAIKTLNGATINGIKLKVMAADEKRNDQCDNELNTDDNTDRKRIKVD